jgi:hypothetical protein
MYLRAVLSFKGAIRPNLIISIRLASNPIVPPSPRSRLYFFIFLLPEPGPSGGGEKPEKKKKKG